MESSVQLLNLREEIKILQREKNCIEEKISLKMKQENEFSAKNLRWLKIINQKVGPEGSEKYSPKKLGAFPSTPQKEVPVIISAIITISNYIIYTKYS